MSQIKRCCWRTSMEPRRQVGGTRDHTRFEAAQTRDAGFASSIIKSGTYSWRPLVSDRRAVPGAVSMSAITYRRSTTARCLPTWDGGDATPARSPSLGDARTRRARPDPARLWRGDVGSVARGWGLRHLSTILLTHMHVDHVLGLPRLLLTLANPRCDR